MRNVIISSVTVLWLVGCGASIPPPTQHFADAQAAQQSATDYGAANLPKAQLHLKLAQDQMAKAKAAMSHGDNKAADSLLLRAKADSELALALTREQNAKGESARATDQSDVQRSLNSQGAQ